MTTRRFLSDDAGLDWACEQPSGRDHWATRCRQVRRVVEKLATLFFEIEGIEFGALESEQLGWGLPWLAHTSTSSVSSAPWLIYSDRPAVRRFYSSRHRRPTRADHVSRPSVPIGGNGVVDRFSQTRR